MLDSAFKNSRKFLGIPLAILVVAVIALVTGGIAMAALVNTATVITTVKEPLTYEYQSATWVEGAEGGHVWMPELYACESQEAWVLIYNAASVDVPISVEAYTYDQVSGVSCSITMLDGDALPTTVVPAYGTVVVYVTVEAACWLEIPNGTPLETAWTVDFRRG